MRGADLKQLWRYGVSLEDRNQAQSFGWKDGRPAQPRPG